MFVLTTNKRNLNQKQKNDIRFKKMFSKEDIIFLSFFNIPQYIRRFSIKGDFNRNSMFFLRERERVKQYW